ncbi:MAG: ribosome maturation factor RimM [Desulfomonilaceae bacterium]
MSQNRLIVIGKVVKPFGIKGEVKISPFTESFESFERSAVLVFDESPYTVRSLRTHKRTAVVALEGVDTREKADKLVGSLVRTDEHNLPPKEEDEYYWIELIGMKVHTSDGRYLGEITQITPTGANDVLHVEGAYGEVLLPMIDSVVVTVDLQSKEMTVDPLEGLIPDA